MVAAVEPGTRERLIAAGRALVVELPLSRMYAGVTTGAVAERAGVTTGAFFHHFPTAAHFADALVRSFVEEHQDQAETIEEMVDALEYDDLLTIMRETLMDSWQLQTTDPDISAVFRGQMLLYAHHDQPLLDPTPELPDVGSVLRRTFRIRQEDAARGWNDLLDRTGLTLVEPFTSGRMATALTALSLGLLVRQAVDPGAVDDDLFAEVATTLTAAVTQPRSAGRRRASDVTAPADEADLSPQARSGARRRRETRRRISEAATGMFDRGWEALSATDVAEVADVSTQTVINLFGSVRGVAACTFVRHIRAYTNALHEHLDDDPLRALRDALRQLAVSAAADPEVARALLGERMAVTLHHGTMLADTDVRVEVPLALALVEALERLDLGGLEPVDLASAMANLVLSHAIPRPGRADVTAELAMRLLPTVARAGRTGHEGDPGPTD
jgi:AcrR family transcriptional regulator